MHQRHLRRSAGRGRQVRVLVGADLCERANVPKRGRQLDVRQACVQVGELRR